MIGELFFLFDFDFTFLAFSISHGNPKMIIVVIDYYLREHNDLKYLLIEKGMM